MVDKVYKVLMDLEGKYDKGISASEICKVLDIDRSTISRYLNILYREKKITKTDGRPVLFNTLKERKVSNYNTFDKMSGANQSLSIPIEKAKAAIIYPPKGLHTLLLGETGVGKSLFAEQMYEYAKEVNVIEQNAPFIRFNCADYVNNPNLLTAQIFGVKKGAFTGADSDRDGLLKLANGGIFFLDEIHRLSPEGQEMLFTYMDKGFFRPLGETEKTIHVNVRIIGATTEALESNLLQTFSRRIPMVIRLPNLRERSLKERYSLTESFLREESHRLGESIYINKNSIISYLLYECPNNIGQLKSDIQLSCAKAFLNYKANLNKLIIINQSDLPIHVRKGLLYLNEYRNEIDELLGTSFDIFKYSEFEEPPLRLTHEEENIGEDFYNIIEDKISYYKKSGMNEIDINEILNIDIESHFHRYIGEISKRYRKNQMHNLVSGEILNIVEEIILLGKKTLGREYDERIYFGLSFHLERSVERIRNGEKIYNPKLNFIRINYEDEFIFAMKVAKIIDSKFNIETPVDEIGYIAMFFASEFFKDSKEKDESVKIIVAMHGRSTASSMVEVVNNLIGSEYVISLDMPLTMKPHTMYEITKKRVTEMNSGKGVILMVDMGSLTNFGHMIMEETGIEVRTVDMVSTLTVLDMARKAIMGYTLDEIFNTSINNRPKNNLNDLKEKKEDIILAACFSGDGLARKVYKIVQERVTNKNIKVMTINIIDDIKLEDRVIELEKKFNIIAIISAIDINIKCIPTISVIDLFSSEGEHLINNIIEEVEMYDKIWNSLKEHLINLNIEMVTKDIKCLINGLEKRLNINVSKDVKMGMALHTCFMIDSLLSGEKTRIFDDLQGFKNIYYKEMYLVNEEFNNIKDNYKVNITDNEIAYIVKLFVENKVCNSV